MRKAIVVDDESDARAFVKAILEAEGWNVDEGVDGEEGLEKITSSDYELAILDVQMPGKSGFDVWEVLAKKDLTTKVVMLTGISEQTGIEYTGEEMGEFYGKKPDAFIEKPIAPDAFKDVINQVAPAG